MEKTVVRRMFQIVAALLVVALVIGLYRAKTEAGAARLRVRALQGDIAARQADINALRAEVAHLESPARVDALAKRELTLAPGGAASARPETEIAAALPAPRAPNSSQTDARQP